MKEGLWVTALRWYGGEMVQRLAEAKLKGQRRSLALLNEVTRLVLERKRMSRRCCSFWLTDWESYSGTTGRI